MREVIVFVPLSYQVVMSASGLLTLSFLRLLAAGRRQETIKMPSNWREATPEVQVTVLDPNVFPAANADYELQRLWNTNGHLYSTW